MTIVHNYQPDELSIVIEDENRPVVQTYRLGAKLGLSAGPVWFLSDVGSDNAWVFFLLITRDGFLRHIIRDYCQSEPGAIQIEDMKKAIQYEITEARDKIERSIDKYSEEIPRLMDRRIEILIEPKRRERISL